jgi:hypothetical protein
LSSKLLTEQHQPPDMESIARISTLLENGVFHNYPKYITGTNFPQQPVISPSTLPRPREARGAHPDHSIAPRLRNC